jgi:hypothetical protein
MVVVTGLFSLITMVVIADFKSGTRVQKLQAAADELAANIRKAQALSYSNSKQMICGADGKVCLSGSSCDATYPTGCTNQFIIRYGFAVDSDGTHRKYMIGADYSDPGSYTAGESIPNGTVTLPANIVIHSVTPAHVSGVYDLSYVYDAANASPFIPCSSDCTTTIVLRDTVTDSLRSVVVHKQTGLAYVE